MRLNGWQRLTVVVIVLWTIVVGIVTWHTWPSTYRPVTIDWSELPKQFRPGTDVTLLMNGIIHENETLTRAQLATRLKAKYPEYADLSDEQLVTRTLEKYPQYNAFIKDTPARFDPSNFYSDSVNRKNRVRAARFAVLLWLLPPVALYGLGYSARWVYRGFKTS